MPIDGTPIEAFSALCLIYQEKTGKTAQEAEQCLNMLTADKRYLVDVWENQHVDDNVKISIVKREANLAVNLPLVSLVKRSKGI